MGVTKDHSDGANGQIRGGGMDTKKIISGEYTFSNSYATGGEDLGIAADFKRVQRVVFGTFPVTATVAAVKFDPDTGNILAYVAAGTEVAAGTNLSTVTVDFIAIGLA
jgi:CO/xanthine dehydrogenase Mo-binding subunit